MAVKVALHPRNKYQGRYDFGQLVAANPALAAFVSRNAWQNETIDFADPAAVKALNRALLQQQYGIQGWDIPPRFLCPPIPGRADYVHHLADLLAHSNGGIVPRGRGIRVLDVGVGANCIYPLLGHAEYGWRFVGSDIDQTALASAQANLEANPDYRTAIELRWQQDRLHIFSGVLKDNELFDLVMCNPPFHASLAEASAGTARKWQGLGKQSAGGRQRQSPPLNFGGQQAELCCDGGEAGFVGRMIAESRHVQNNSLWFTALISKAANLPLLARALKQAGVQAQRTIAMAQGQKHSRILAWSFLTPGQQQAWRNQHRAE